MSEARPRTRVVIAGGGTAGWLAAAALVAQLGELIDVILVESDEIGIVGVGESTIPTTRAFHGLLGVDEAAFMRATHATFKLGISFENWDRIGERYFHPFGSVGRSVVMADFQHFWLEARDRGIASAYTDYSLEASAAAAERFALGGEPALAYAYHLDATTYARFLRSRAEPAGVTRVEGRIERVELAEGSGDIAALHLASGERVAGDLFIDCTGFRALLTGEALGTGFVDWREWLATDSALAVQTEASGPPVPYTRAIAHGAGWRWRIPLQHRVGNGLVFASEFMSEDEARATLLGALDGAPLFEPRLIRYRTGMREHAWSRNCIALGLAAGFIEPLESTSIHLVMSAVTRLIQAFPFAGASDALRNRYNAQAREEWEHVRDFIILHYALTHRDDAPFWRRCAAMALPDTLNSRIALFRESAAAYQAQDELFRVDSWASVMLGQGVVPATHHRIANLLPADAMRTAFADLRQGIVRTVAGLPSHAQAVAGYVGSVSQPA
ncbi:MULTISPECIES: tryptophan halogenase family protein [unclassified Sphingomonas]|jgi:tryptophan halogenase|uniref:tryptophan halogenase family protein n=1 Tax=unclassified Sphingomonas TaxID=196159 RepID=UPI00226A2CA6|nr:MULTISPECIES: tryptophan halogenase family protein [unclassified Sphingomonas]